MGVLGGLVVRYLGLGGGGGVVNLVVYKAMRFDSYVLSRSEQLVILPACSVILPKPSSAPVLLSSPLLKNSVQHWLFRVRGI